MLSLCTSAMVRRSLLQRIDHIAGHISNQKLRHACMISHDSAL